MQSKVLTTVLWAMIALCVTGCVSTRNAKSEIRSQTTQQSSDTLREQVVVTLMDTILEVTTITVRESEAGDTLRMTTVTDRTRASTRDRYHDVQEKVIVKTDTVYVERQTDKQVAVAAGSNMEIDKEGNVTKRINRIAQTLKWVCFTLLSLTAFIIILKFGKRLL